MVVGRGEDTVEPDARVDQADEEPVVQHDPPILQNGRRPAGRPQRQQDPQEKDGQAVCSDRASKLARFRQRDLDACIALKVFLFWPFAR